MREAEAGGWFAPQSVAERHVPGVGPIEIHRLTRGSANDIYRVVRDGRAYALRAAAASPPGLGVDRLWEARVLEGAVAADLAPALMYCDPERGILISRWAEGRSWSIEDTRRPENLSRMAELLRRIHALPMPVPARIMTPGQWMDYYSAAAPTARAAKLRSAAEDRLRAWAALPGVPPVVCHSDLHTLNLIDRGGPLVLLDWEYAHASDPFWDLAGWSANNDFEDETTWELLARYAGRAPTPDERLRLRHLRWLYDYVCLLWSELYLSAGGGRPQGDSALHEISARAQWLVERLHASLPAFPDGPAELK